MSERHGERERPGLARVLSSPPAADEAVPVRSESIPGLGVILPKPWQASSSYGVYIPVWRLQPRRHQRRRSAPAAAAGTRSVAELRRGHHVDGRRGGTRSRCARRRTARSRPPSGSPRPRPAYLDKTNANTIHAALALPSSVGAYDCIGSTRSSSAAIMGAVLPQRAGGRVRHPHRPARRRRRVERRRRCGRARCSATGDDVIAEPIGGASVSARVRRPLARARRVSSSKQWEERFGEHAYAPLVEQAVNDAMKSAGITIGDVDHVIVTGLHTRAVSAAKKSIGARPDAIVDDLTVVDRPDRHRALDAAAVRRARPRRARARRSPSSTSPTAATSGCSAPPRRSPHGGRPERSARHGRRRPTISSYPNFLTWRGHLHREPPRRPEPDRTASPPSLRASAWKYGLFGSRDEEGFVHLPPSRVSMRGGAIDRMEMVRMADVKATVATFTVDRLAFSLARPSSRPSSTSTAAAGSSAS